MKQFESVTVQNMDVIIHMLVTGDKRRGVPLVFLPGITSFSKSFVDVINLLPDDYYCVSVDIRGRGQSTWVKTGYRLEDYASDVLSILNFLIDNPISPILVGHSMGARIAAKVVQLYPKLVTGAILVDPPINGPGQREVYPTPLDAFLTQKRIADSGDMDLFKPYFAGLSDHLIRLRFEEYKNTALEAIIETYRAFFLESFHVLVKSVERPMLLLAAENGDTIRPEEFDTLNRLNTSVQGIRVPNVGHMIYKDAPEHFVGYVQDFVQSVLSGTRNH